MEVLKQESKCVWVMRLDKIKEQERQKALRAWEVLIEKNFGLQKEIQKIQHLVENKRDSPKPDKYENLALMNKNLKRENEVLKMELNTLEDKWVRESHKSYRSNAKSIESPWKCNNYRSPRFNDITNQINNQNFDISQEHHPTFGEAKASYIDSMKENENYRR